MPNEIKGIRSIEGLPPNWFIPTTRYRGSKRKILPWIWENIRDLPFDNALDLFGGTGTVSILLKRMGKKVTCNDYLQYNYLSAIAFVENSDTKLTDEDLNFIRSGHDNGASSSFIADTFRGYYFLDSENEWLDRTVASISALNRFYSGKILCQKQALALWSLGQACLIKRPFNLFHRKNLNLRTKNVVRNFGNKSTWEIPFPDAMYRFAEEANRAVFDNGRQNKALCLDAFQVEQIDYDLVYCDPPYFLESKSDVDYRELYHFLDGIAQYERWSEQIDHSSYNLRLKRDAMLWPARSIDKLTKLYSLLIDRFGDSIIVISHKSGSLVSVDTIRQLLTKRGKKVRLCETPYTYALNKSNGKPQHSTEYLLIGT
jgi:adenine-specific DNA-methyltransferase